jgi:hypothetical protein|tara:strand:- start:2455 stop:2628 length:174 start_codon:yes stop_codon:yes gene_type:complete
LCRAGRDTPRLPVCFRTAPYRATRTDEADQADQEVRRDRRRDEAPTNKTPIKGTAKK